jgi:hypothetical protein
VALWEGVRDRIVDGLERRTIESRGFFGIQPLSTPSLYDHKGERGLLTSALVPIFQVQKNHCWEMYVRRKHKIDAVCDRSYLQGVHR